MPDEQPPAGLARSLSRLAEALKGMSDQLTDLSQRRMAQERLSVATAILLMRASPEPLKAVDALRTLALEQLAADDPALAPVRDHLERLMGLIEGAAAAKGR